MRWRGREKSRHVEDRRGARGPGRGPRTVGGLGGIVILIVAVVALYNGVDPRPFLDAVGQQPAANQPAAAGSGIEDDHREFVEVVLRDTEKVWERLFDEQVSGASYRPPKLVLFSHRVATGCGMAGSETGPFYCPPDETIYIDPAFFGEMERRLKAPGDFAQAYVIAHEVAHHVQELTGLNRFINRARMTRDPTTINRASVRYELQADYLAGVWAHHARRQFNILEEGDISEAINAANRIGDDTLQRMSTGVVIPERFTHGTSAQRVRWFKAGLESGDLNGCQQLFEIDYDQL